jgi:DNA-binding transcriptional ArsR family regulator
MRICSCKGNCACERCSCKGYALFFDALGNKTRLHLLNALLEKPKTVSEIITETGIEQTAASHGLKRLHEAGMITMKPKGKFRVYALNEKTIAPLLTLIDTHVHTYCMTKVKK